MSNERDIKKDCSCCLCHCLCIFGSSVRNNFLWLLYDWKRIYRIGRGVCLKTNKDVIGWLYIPDTKIDEPILKGKDNDTYLYTDIYKKSNKAGSIFIDEINKGDLSDDNTIIYGHNMKNGSRFHDLRYFIENDYFQKHPLIYIYLPDGTVNVYNVFASCVIKSTSDLYQKGIQYSKYIQSVLKQASVKGTVSDEEKPLIMLSTCYNGTDNRYVVYAQLKENVKESSVQ